ncbi:KilA-N domain-containing protein [Sphingobacterium multivorum]|uniref:KilA-N domain-containing protein n=1 Tax=Sphingobacterium multivorum TaxID=28454 RepID=UPI003DA495B8
MQNQTFNYHGKEVEFSIMDGEVLVNATEMGKAFGKRPVDFLKLESTKAYIEQLKSSFIEFRSEESSLLNSMEQDSSDENDGKTTESSLLKPIEIVITSKGRGEDGGVTWMHSRLALKFAAWLDVKFEIWVYEMINSITFGSLKEANESMKLKADLLNKKNQIEMELMNNEKFREYMEIVNKINRASNRVRKHNSNQLMMFMGTQG